jgi:hypothetical protein
MRIGCIENVVREWEYNVRERVDYVLHLKLYAVNIQCTSRCSSCLLGSAKSIVCV